MSDQATLDGTNSTFIDSYRVLCKGCRTTQPLPLFLYPVDASCYRVRMQCKRCIDKSVKHWRAHREDLKAARAIRERNLERIACVCGTSINVRHRAKHCQSKRHLSVVAILRQHNALAPSISASITSASAPAAERRGYTVQDEFTEPLAAAEKQLVAYEAIRERHRSLPKTSHVSALLAATTAATTAPAEQAPSRLSLPPPPLLNSLAVG